MKMAATNEPLRRGRGNALEFSCRRFERHVGNRRACLLRGRLLDSDSDVQHVFAVARTKSVKAR